jgi:hypothetical protein
MFYCENGLNIEKKDNGLWQFEIAKQNLTVRNLIISETYKEFLTDELVKFKEKVIFSGDFLMTWKKYSSLLRVEEIILKCRKKDFKIIVYGNCDLALRAIFEVLQYFDSEECKNQMKFYGTQLLKNPTN